MPYPYVESDMREVRPALVIYATEVRPGLPVLWALMITSAANQGWTGDVSLIDRHLECGLPVPSVIRTAKIATLDARSATRVGVLPEDIWQDLSHMLSARFNV